MTTSPLIDRTWDARSHDGSPEGLRRYHHANWLHHLNAADHAAADQWRGSARWHLAQMLGAS